MTAPTHTHGQRVNSSAGNGDSDADAESHAAVPNADAQAVLEYLDERGGDCTIEQIRGRLRVPRAYLKTILQDLETDGHIDVNAGFNSVTVTRLTDTGDREAIPDGGTQKSDQLTVDLAARDIYRAACNRRRRSTIRILSALRNADDVDISRYVPVQALACAIVAAREGVEPETVDSDDRSSVYVTLIQTHLPLLDRLELVSYHDRPQKVEITPDGLAVAELLETVDRVAVRTEDRAGADIFHEATPGEWGER
jgi:hypothetical protein